MKAAILLMALAGCAAPRAGMKCGNGDAYCADAKTALACREGILATFPCSGPAACVMGKDRGVTCDQSAGGTVGDLCLPEYGGRAKCTAEGKGYLFCADGRWKELQCAYGSRCISSDGALTCKPPEVK